MHSVKILAVGKNKEKWLQEGWSLYAKRLKPHLQLELFSFRTKAAFDLVLQKEPKAVLLDSQGRLYDSKHFQMFLWKRAREQKGHLTIAIGPPEGFSLFEKKSALERGLLLSLSAMTLTHQMVRLLLIEQLYRAVQIDSGTPYDK